MHPRQRPAIGTSWTSIARARRYSTFPEQQRQYGRGPRMPHLQVRARVDCGDGSDAQASAALGL